MSQSEQGTRCLAPGPVSVAFVGDKHDLRSWESYERGGGYLGSEAYWSSSMHYALRRLNISVDFWPTLPPRYDARVGSPKNNSLMADMEVLRKADRAKYYHRFILSGFPAARLPILTHFLEPSLLCRVRIASWWDVGLAASVGERDGVDSDHHSVAGEHKGSAARGVDGSQQGRQTFPRRSGGTHVGVTGPGRQPPLVDPRLMLTPHANDLASPIPYFPHSTVTLTPSLNATGRGRHGFLLGKNCPILGRHPHIIRSLLDAKFTLHSTASCHHLWPQVVHHGMMTPSDFAQLLRQMAFLVGVGAVAVSPSPLEALANGASYLNPRNRTTGANAARWPGGDTSFRHQHPILARLGAPYVYNYDIDDPRSLVAAAERATHYRFASFVPHAHRIETTLGAACANLVDHDAPCACQAARAAGDWTYPGCRAVPPSALASLVWSDDEGYTVGGEAAAG